MFSLVLLHFHMSAKYTIFPNIQVTTKVINSVHLWIISLLPKYAFYGREMRFFVSVISKGRVTSSCFRTDEIQGVPFATEPGISLIILTPMKILQRNLNRSTFVVWEMKRNVSVVRVCHHISYTMRNVRFKFRCNILISGKIIKEMPGSVASGTHGIGHWSPFITFSHTVPQYFEMCNIPSLTLSNKAT